VSDPEGVRVLKFGGSSLREGDDFTHVAQLVADRGEPVVLVVSALNGLTDEILATLDEVQRGDEPIDPFLERVRERHETVLAEAAPDHVEAGRRALDPVLEEFERLLYGIAYTEEVTPKTKDFAVSFGERLAARLLAFALRQQGCQASAHDADDLGIVTDGTYGLATARMGPTEHNVRDELVPRIQDGQVPVVTGFFGRDEEGHVTTFGRGGSDYSGAVLAQALAADALEVWKDVDGFLTADPERVSQARPIDEMTYDEAAELAYLGVRVLHPRTVEPLHESTIPILVKNTLNPDAPGTRIGPPMEEPEHLRAIGAREGFAIVRMQGSGMASTPGVGRDVFATLADHDINVVNMAASQASFAILVDEDDADEAADVIRETDIPTVEEITVNRGFSLVCFVGQDIGSHPGVAGEVFTVVGEADVNVNMISVGSSEVALSFVVADDDVGTTLSALHDAFLGPETSDETDARGPDRTPQGPRTEVQG
jgi:aspartate kinase